MAVLKHLVHLIYSCLVIVRDALVVHMPLALVLCAMAKPTTAPCPHYLLLLSQPHSTLWNWTPQNPLNPLELRHPTAYASVLHGGLARSSPLISNVLALCKQRRVRPAAGEQRVDCQRALGDRVARDKREQRHQACLIPVQRLRAVAHDT